MKTWLLLICCLGALPTDATLAAAAPPQVTNISLPDGTMAEATPECALGDLCATIHHANGDVTEVYSEGSGECQPFHVKFVRLRNGQRLFDYDEQTFHADQGLYNSKTCGKDLDTWLVLDQGRLRMGLLQVPDGTLRVKFEAVGH